jgi:formamidopyrimidine-DNA glycosylase
VPELPDVEGFRRVLERHAAGRPVTRVEVLDASMLRNSSSRALDRALEGRRFRRPERHGKWVVAPAGQAFVLMHFGMTGLLEWVGAGAERHPHDRLVFVCAEGELRYRNMRKLGGVWLARHTADRERIIGALGPDAAGIERDDFHARLGRRQGRIKPALMDQRLLAGVGNLMADEILWRAGIEPRTPCPRIGRLRRDRLYDALRGVVRESIPAGRVPHGARWLTSVRDSPRAACPRCGSRLRKATVAGRTACWCPHCQRR